VEVADTTVRYDRNIKLPRFAAAGIPEVWIEDLNSDVLLVYRDSQGDQYRTVLTLRRGESVSPTAFPDIRFALDDLLGDPGARLT
jgi:Uma2 family endonuclease